jgi:hypothetical protein
MYKHQRNNCEYVKNENSCVTQLKNNHSKDELYEKIKDLETQNKTLLKMMDKNTDLASKNADLAIQNSKTAEKSIRGITYAMKHLNNAHQLKLLEGKEAVKLLTYDNKKTTYDTVETIIIKHKNRLLDKHLGDILVGAYKKEDPEIQSVWGVDTNRLHFILKREEWTSDDCGLKLTNFVIDPFLKSVEKMIRNYCTNYQPNNKETSEYENNKSSYDTFVKKWKFCEEILIDISKGKLHKQILKYISPRLKLTSDVIFKKSNKKKHSGNESMSDSDDVSSESTSSNSPEKKPRKVRPSKKPSKNMIIYNNSDSDTD